VEGRLRQAAARPRAWVAVLAAFAAIGVVGAAATVASATTGTIGGCTFSSSSTGTKPSLVKANDANHDGVFSPSETVPNGATYPYTVTYRLTIDPGTAGSHCIASFTDTLVSSLSGLVSTHKPSGGTDCKDLVYTLIVAPNTYTCYYDVTFSATQAAQGSIGNTATMTWDLNLQGNNTTSNNSIVYFTAPTTTSQGLTPGYWKQSQHFFAWRIYTQTDTFDSVFSVTVFPSSFTLLDALAQGGGGVNALGRQGVAALLNAASGTLSYPLTTAQVITLVHNAIVSGDATTIENVKDLLQSYNTN